VHGTKREEMTISFGSSELLYWLMILVDLFYGLLHLLSFKLTFILWYHYQE